MPYDNPIERRLTMKLMAYWEKLRGQRDMPCENDVEPDDLDDLWDFCFLVHVRDLEKKDYNYTYLGSALVEAYRGGMAEEDTYLATPNSDELREHYQKVIESGKPLLNDGDFMNLSGQTVLYRQVLLPLGEDGRVEAILGGMRYKISE